MSLAQGITLRLTDDRGRVLRRDGQSLEFALFDTRSRARAPQDWIATGVRIASLAFLVWIDAVVGCGDGSRVRRVQPHRIGAARGGVGHRHPDRSLVSGERAAIRGADSGEVANGLTTVR